MSVAKRLISGSAASWTRILITMFSQVALVPLFLSYWSKETYGIWIAVQALMVLFTLPDSGHQDFLGFEFLRLGINRRKEISLSLWSGARMAFFIGLVEVLLVIIFISTGFLKTLLGDKSGTIDAATIHAAGVVLLLQSIAWFFNRTITSVFTRSLETFGYFPRMAWWAVWTAMITSVTPAVVVYFGGGLILTGAVTCIITIIVTIFQLFDVFHLLKKEQLMFSSYSWKLGHSNFFRSLALSGRYLLENVRQQGVRLILPSIVGPSGLAAFATMRTGANVAMQGLSTITYPMMPELMRFLNQKDQERSEAAFGTVWFAVVTIMAPAVLILQAVIEPLYTIWTRGKIPFNPSLFAMLSLGVLVFAVEQPSMAIMKGNNLLKQQLIVSSCAASTVVAGMFLLVPKVGIAGAGLALLIAEVVATAGYRIYSRKWMRENGLLWPKKPYLITNLSVWGTALVMILMIIFPKWKVIFLIPSLPLLAWNIVRYWKALPQLASERLKSMIIKRKKQPQQFKEESFDENITA